MALQKNVNNTSFRASYFGARLNVIEWFNSYFNQLFRAAVNKTPTVMILEKKKIPNVNIGI